MNSKMRIRRIESLYLLYPMSWRRIISLLRGNTIRSFINGEHGIYSRYYYRNANLTTFKAPPLHPRLGQQKELQRPPLRPPSRPHPAPNVRKPRPGLQRRLDRRIRRLRIRHPINLHQPTLLPRRSRRKLLRPRILAKQNLRLQRSKRRLARRESTSFVGFGECAFEALTLPYHGPDAEARSEKYQMAEFLIWEMLANASVWKVPHATGLTHSVQLGTLLDLPENEGMDALPGSFGELFRWGTVNLRQTREGIEMMPTPRPSRTWKKGVLEV